MIVISDDKKNVEKMSENLKAARNSLHSRCIACGRENRHGLDLDFIVCKNGVIETCFSCNKEYQGYENYLHGGIIATLLDSVMTNCLFAHGYIGLTGELNIRYHEPVTVTTTAVIRAWLHRSTHRLHIVHSELEQNGIIKVHGTGKFLERG